LILRFWSSEASISLGVRGVGSSNLPVPTNLFVVAAQGLARRLISRF
jgi:hypothetical protein